MHMGFSKRIMDSLDTILNRTVLYYYQYFPVCPLYKYIPSTCKNLSSSVPFDIMCVCLCVCVCGGGGGTLCVGDIKCAWVHLFVHLWLNS